MLPIAPAAMASATVTVTALRELSARLVPDTDTSYVVVAVRFGEGVNVAPVCIAEPPVAALYHLKVGPVTELAAAVKVATSPLHIGNVPAPVTVMISSPTAVTVITTPSV